MVIENLAAIPPIPTIGAGMLLPPLRTKERSSSKVKYTSVSSGQPITIATRGRGHADDWGAQGVRSSQAGDTVAVGGSMKSCVPEIEYPSVLGCHPIATCWVCGYRDNRRAQRVSSGKASKPVGVCRSIVCGSETIGRATSTCEHISIMGGAKTRPREPC